MSNQSVSTQQVAEAVEKIGHWVMLTRKRLPGKRQCKKGMRSREECPYCSAEDARDQASSALMELSPILAELLSDCATVLLNLDGRTHRRRRLVRLRPSLLSRFVREVAKL